jgi:DNA-binding transcriptional LysR family regulator
VHLEYCHPSKVYSAVLNEEADLGVVSYPKGTRDLKVTPWIEEEMAIACPPGHRLAGRERMRLEELDGEKFVAFEAHLIIRREIDRAFKKRHVSVEVVSEFDNIETIKQALEISEAVSILPRASIEREVERGTLVEIRLEGIKLMRTVGFVVRRKRRFTPTAEQFLGTLLASPALGAGQTVVARPEEGADGAPGGAKAAPVGEAG